LVQQLQLQTSTLSPIPTSLVEKVPELSKFATFDLEWYRDDLKTNREKGIAGDIYSRNCLVDGYGSNVKLHNNDFRNRLEFILTILNIINRLAENFN